MGGDWKWSVWQKQEILMAKAGGEGNGSKTPVELIFYIKGKNSCKTGAEECCLRRNDPSFQAAGGRMDRKRKDWNMQRM